MKGHVWRLRCNIRAQPNHREISKRFFCPHSGQLQPCAKTIPISKLSRRSSTAKSGQNIDTVSCRAIEYTSLIFFDICLFRRVHPSPLFHNQELFGVLRSCHSSRGHSCESVCASPRANVSSFLRPNWGSDRVREWEKRQWKVLNTTKCACAVFVKK